MDKIDKLEEKIDLEKTTKAAINNKDDFRRRLSLPVNLIDINMLTKANEENNIIDDDDLSIATPEELVEEKKPKTPEAKSWPHDLR